MKVPAGSANGRTLRLKGRGVKTSKATGDLLVTLDVVVPQNLSKEAKAAVEPFASATTHQPPRGARAARQTVYKTPPPAPPPGARGALLHLATSRGGRNRMKGMDHEQ